MASDNNKIKHLAAEAPEGPTSEIEILSVDLMPTEEELEMDANTFSLDEDGSDSSNVATLQSDLRSKDERISSLQFDIEQLRARWTGLEKEINAREELTEILQTDLKAAHKALAAKDKQLARNERDLSALTAKLDAAMSAREAADQRLTEVERNFDELSKNSAEESEQIVNLTKELEAAAALQPAGDRYEQEIAESRLAIAELNSYIDGRRDDWERQTVELESLTAGLTEKNRRIGEQVEQLAATESKLNSVDAERIRVSDRLKDKQAQLKATKKDVRGYQKELDDYRDGEQAANKKLIVEQEGTVAGNRRHIGILESQNRKTEQYADELRAKLSIAMEESNSHANRRDLVEQALLVAKKDIQGLENQLEIEQGRAAELQQTNDRMQQEFDEEIGKLRLELGEAQETIVGHETVTEQLTSDLIENQSFKNALENQLGSANETHEAQLEALQKRSLQLESQLEEDERKIGNKDNAISALLNELANKSRTIESIDEIENVIHEIDDRMSERIDDRVILDRDRPTRLLVGRVDGQELRFPLFKDRLTIGRTVQNDIQLRAQFISRRHAVMLADEDGTKIVDWGSKNGVYVNNAKISEQVLTSGDKVTIGTADFIYEELPRR